MGAAAEIKAALLQEGSPLTLDEISFWAECTPKLDMKTVQSTLSHTQIVQCIRGWQTEKERVKETVENINRIVKWKISSKCKENTHLPNSDVDFLTASWGSVIYGADEHNHLVFVEGIKTIKATDILGHFKDDELLMNTRGVIMEALEIKKGNYVEGEEVNKTYKHIYIFDLAGLEMSHFSAAVRRIVKNVIVEIGNIYAESLYKMFIVNSPFVFRGVWSIISPWLHPVTRNKIKILGGGSSLVKELVKNEIPIESIPKNLGGGHEGRNIIEDIRAWRSERERENETI